MIRHLPEGLVPFEDCGYARQPLHPLEGQEIRLAACATARPRCWKRPTDGKLRAGRGRRRIAMGGGFPQKREPCGIALSAERKAPRGSKRTFFAPFP